MLQRSKNCVGNNDCAFSADQRKKLFKLRKNICEDIFTFTIKI